MPGAHRDPTTADDKARAAPAASPCSDANGREFLRSLALTAAGDTAIALALTPLLSDFLACFVYSQAIGLSILLLSWGAHLALRARPLNWRISAVTIPLGGVVGIGLARAWDARRQGYPYLSFARPRELLFSIGIALVFGTIFTFVYRGRLQLAEERARLREELLRREEDARRLAEAELKLLQAQIEPHFLFNTLSNVLSLIDPDPAGARRMLLNLTCYLRGALRRTREGATTLGEELELVRAYLEIQAVRMGPRLAWTVDCPPELAALPLPPLLLQPLVENAVRHGLEPSPAGGALAVRAAREGGLLLLEVRDTGVGLAPAGVGGGVGLANVRARVRAVSQGQGRVVLRPGEGGGLAVRLELPLAAPGAAAGGPA